MGNIEKRVIEVHATVANVRGLWRRIAASADATLPEFYRTISGAFGWFSPMYAEFVANEKRYALSVGSRTRLKSVLQPEGRCMLTLADERYQFLILIDVLATYEVPSRRHYPKVLDGAGSFYSSHRNFYADFATRDAQDVARYGWQGLNEA